MTSLYSDRNVVIIWRLHIKFIKIHFDYKNHCQIEPAALFVYKDIYY